MGTKKSMVVDGEGGPLGVVIAGANVLERRLLKGTIEAIVVERPEPTAEQPQHMPLDGGYDNPTGRAAAEEAKSIPHIHKGNEVVKPSERKPGYKPRRWVVERTFAWLGRCRIHSRDYERTPGASEAQVQISMIQLMLRRLAGEKHEAPYRYRRPEKNIAA
jgi:putative transposase